MGMAAPYDFKLLVGMLCLLGGILTAACTFGIAAGGGSAALTPSAGGGGTPLIAPGPNAGAAGGGAGTPFGVPGPNAGRNACGAKPPGTEPCTATKSALASASAASAVRACLRSSPPSLPLPLL